MCIFLSISLLNQCENQSNVIFSKNTILFFCRLFVLGCQWPCIHRFHQIWVSSKSVLGPPHQPHSRPSPLYIHSLSNVPHFDLQAGKDTLTYAVQWSKSIGSFVFAETHKNLRIVFKRIVYCSTKSHVYLPCRQPHSQYYITYIEANLRIFLARRRWKTQFRANYLQICRDKLPQCLP